MSEKTEKKRMNAQEIKEIFGAFSTELPSLIKSIMASVFSEDAGRNMGKAAGAFYKELKESGMPDDIAVKMTENYIGVFTSLGDMLKTAGGRGKMSISPEKRDELSKEIEKRVKEKIAERREEEAEEE